MQFEFLYQELAKGPDIVTSLLAGVSQIGQPNAKPRLGS